MDKKHFAAGAALGALFVMSPSLAADLPSHKAPPPVIPAPIFTWTGFYIGFNSGFGGGVVDANVALIGPAAFTATQTSNRASGAVIGGQIGYNYQLQNNVVIGLESDFQWSNIRASHQATNYASIGLPGYTYNDIHNGIDWFGTTRARLGYSFGRFLPYVTGGVAYGQVEASGLQVFGAGAVINAARTDTKVGWSVGAGSDIAITSNLSARAEYLYLELPGVNGPAGALTILGPLAGGFSTSTFGAHIFRAGANWRFNNVGELASVASLNPMSLLFAPPAANWSGFYAGVNGGYGGGTADATINLVSPLLATSTTTTNRLGGFLAGGQIGYNHQYSNNIVVGLESDFQWTNIGAWHQATTAPGFVFTDIRNQLNWLGTTRARLGWASGPAFTYLTGGVAYGELGANGTQFTGGGLFGGSASTVKIGWTAGAGAEYALSDHLSLKAEYLYVDFEGVRGPAYGAAPVGAFGGDVSTGTFGTHITRVGLNWRLGGAVAAPVLAKY